ncbi:helix-turn-helix transcriptional regulator [Streptomyces sp. NPDC050560]|uniref:helix-turn-helix transcriptional regulator n=1 Tax=Streptomyces sp. NPDC050560 TaxID=3365630 RepID=UPI003795AA81
MADSTELGRFLRTRREALRPGDVGLTAGSRRRTPGLRREEVAALANVSADYYERLEQGRKANPSPALLAALARALRLSADERDHLYVVAGQRPPSGFLGHGYVDPGLMHILDALVTTPALVNDDLGHVVAQNPLGVALLGPWAERPGREANTVWRWFTDPSSRALYPPEDHEHLGRTYVAQFRGAAYRHEKDPLARGMLKDLLAGSAEFRALWDLGEVAAMTSTRKTLLHERAGRLDVQCDVVLSPRTGNSLIMFRPQPGSETAEKLDFLRVLGVESFTQGA